MPEYTMAYLMRYRCDMRYCRSLLRSGSRSFHAASKLLPGYYRAAATALYAFCRVADDLIDQQDEHEGALQELQHRLALIYRGEPIDHPVDRAFTDVVSRFGIPRALPGALLEGFEWDAHGRRYQDLSELYAYGARVAGTVGVMMSMLMGMRDAATLARACDLGVAMQLTNIARDVGEDARSGRLYLPVDWLLGEGLDPDAWLRSPAPHPAISSAVDRLLLAAEELYDEAAPGIDRLPGRCRPCIHAARSIYREIGRHQQRERIDPVVQRSVVGSQRKVRLLWSAVLDSTRPIRQPTRPPLEETRFLIDSAVGA